MRNSFKNYRDIAIEYGLIATVIAIAAISALSLLGTKSEGITSTVSSSSDINKSNDRSQGHHK